MNECRSGAQCVKCRVDCAQLASADCNCVMRVTVSANSALSAVSVQLSVASVMNEWDGMQCNPVIAYDNEWSAAMQTDCRTRCEGDCATHAGNARDTVCTILPPACLMQCHAFTLLRCCSIVRTVGANMRTAVAYNTGA